MALNLNPEIALRLRKSRHRLASATPIVRRDKNSDEKPNNDRPFTSDIAEDLDQILDDSILKQNQRAIAAHLNDDHYVRRFTPGDFVLGGAAVPSFVHITAAGPRWPAIEMPDGGSSIAIVSWGKPSEWRSGKLRIRCWYTSEIGSTSNFYVKVNLDAIRGTEIVPGTSLYDVNTQMAGPAVAYTVIKTSNVYTTTSIGSDDELFCLRITRIGADASDTNVNDFLLMYAEVEHIPAQRESQ